MKYYINIIVLFIVFILCRHVATAQIITTIAGNGVAGYSVDGIPATATQLNGPWTIIMDRNRNFYISDGDNNRIRKIDGSGIITTIAGTGVGGYSGDGGPATDAQIHVPTGLGLDDTGNLYFGEYLNNRVRKINTMGIISTVAGTGVYGYFGEGIAATMAQMKPPTDICIDNSNNLYVADVANFRVRKTTIGIIRTIAGNGVSDYTGDGGSATDAAITYPWAIGLDFAGNLYIADHAGGNIRKVSSGGIITTFAGTGLPGYGGDGGPATAAQIDAPQGIAADGCGNLYFTDAARIRKINPIGIIRTIAGTGVGGFSGDGGPADIAQISVTSNGIYVDSFLNIYFADRNNNRVRRISNSNHMPAFTEGHFQNFIICNDTTLVMDSLLAASDLDTLQQETWSVVMPPLHGALVAAYSATSTGGTIVPTGLSYIPTTGYVGNDSFKVTVRDCGNLADTTTVHVKVNGCTLASPRPSPEEREVLRVSPNPAKDELTIGLDHGSYNSIVITNTLGQVLVSQQMNATQTNVSLKSLPAGLYYLMVRGESGVKVLKFEKL